MKVLIVSDNHGQSKELYAVLKKTRPFDYLIHLGDTEGTDRMIRREAKTPVTIVRGNNDFFSDAEKEAVLTFGNCRIFCCPRMDTIRGRWRPRAQTVRWNAATGSSDPMLTVESGTISRQEEGPRYVLISTFETHYTLISPTWARGA